MRRAGLRLLIAALAAGILASAWAGASASALAQQVSSERGVTVRVTPRELAPAAKSWEFEIVLETHSQDLTDDLKAEASLVADGAKQAPTAWQGTPPGGHHRTGVLRFAPVTPRPETVELRLLRPGESSPRSFRWRLK